MNFRCPNCNGGFEEPISESTGEGKKRSCPWCRQEMGEYQPEDPFARMEEYMEHMQEELGGTESGTDKFRYDSDSNNDGIL